MANDGSVVVPPDSTGKKVDCSSLSVAGATVYRQRVVIGDPTRSAGLALVSSGALQVVNVAGTANIGAVSIGAGTAHMGEVSVVGAVTVSNTVTISGQVSVTGSVAISNNINISAMPSVVLAAGAANIGTIQAISATVNVNIAAQSAGLTLAVSLGTALNISAMPAVVIAAGTNNIGTLNGISATVIVAGSLSIGGFAGNSSVTAASSFTLIGGTDGSLGRVALMDAAGHQIISGTVALAAGAANIGTINNISAAVVIAAGTANIGTINNISATVLVAGSFTVGGQTGNASATVGSTYTLIGGMDGSIGRVALTDAAGHFVVTGTVALTTLNGLGKIDGISANVNVVLQAGANNIGTINNISAGIVLAAGAANIGTINNISAAVGLAAGTQHIGEVNISVFPALVAGTAHIGEVNISLMPVVSVNITAASAGVVLGVSLGTQVVLAGGTANIGAVSLGAQVAGASGVTAGSTVILAGCGSRVSGGATMSAAVAWVDPNGRSVVVLNHPSIVASATQGPQNKDITATAFATLVASAGANCVYITGILVTNGSSSLTGVAFAGSDSTAAPQVVAWLAASGGGFNKDFHPPWKLSAGTALQGRIFPAAALTVTSVISFYVGP